MIAVSVDREDKVRQSYRNAYESLLAPHGKLEMTGSLTQRKGCETKLAQR